MLGNEKLLSPLPTDEMDRNKLGRYTVILRLTGKAKAFDWSKKRVKTSRKERARTVCMYIRYKHYM
jgi:hypothetical protein